LKRIEAPYFKTNFTGLTKYLICQYRFLKRTKKQIMTMALKRTVFSLLLSLWAFMAYAQEPAGVWLTQDKDAQVEIYKTSAGIYEGKIIWVKSTKPEVQQRIGTKILSAFKKKDTKTYESGRIYHPGQGKYYDGIITMKSDKLLHLRGYVGTPMLGQTQTWTRVK